MTGLHGATHGRVVPVRTAQITLRTHQVILIRVTRLFSEIRKSSQVLASLVLASSVLASLVLASLVLASSVLASSVLASLVLASLVLASSVLAVYVVSRYWWVILISELVGFFLYCGPFFDPVIIMFIYEVTMGSTFLMNV